MNYWDTSCLLKLYVEEEGTSTYAALQQIQAEPIVTSVLTEVEFAFALSRKETDGQLKRGGASALTQLLLHHAATGRIRFLPIGPDVLASAMTLAKRCAASKKPRLFLRTLDGIHLATALVWRADRLITADLRLQDAARFCRLKV